MIITSVHVGITAVREHQGKQIDTACFKYPADGPVQLSRTGLAGDQQGDTVRHGGPDKAVLAYPAAHYRHWTQFLGQDPGPAVLGENFTVDGATEADVCIGDTYRVGGAVVQVAQPRVPCSKMNLRHGRTDVLPEIVRTGYTGFYLRVLEEGPVQAGDSLIRLSRPADAPSVAYINRIRHHESHNRAALERILAAEGLAAVWVDWLRNRLG